MTVVIGEYTFENATFETKDASAVMVAPADQSISELEEILGEESTIEVYDGEELIGRYYNRELVSIAIAVAKEVRMATVTFYASVLAIDIEQQLIDGIDDSDDAIIELAGLIAMDEEDIDGLKDDVKDIQDEITRLQESVTSLSAKVSAIPKDLADTLVRIDNRLNNLADRVSDLENK